MASPHPMAAILNPKSIAIVGASTNPATRGYAYVRHLRDYGYRGEIYPVNPRYSEILGLKVYPRLREIPDSVDFVISCVPAPEVLSMLEDCAPRRVKAVHLFTARFGETGRREAAELEQTILNRARKDGIRLIGPNCMGIYNPGAGIHFSYDLPLEAGPVGLASQTGGGAISLINSAALRGVRFSKVISYGNALDYNECDFLDYFRQDPETKIILMYIEGVKEGRRFFNTLRQTTATKPVIIAKGGRGEAGTRAVASHTASLAGARRIWETAIAQAGAISAQNLDEMADLAVSFCFLPPIRGSRVGIGGGGGGASVLAADECEEAGLEVTPIPDEIRQELKRAGIPIWDWLGNPVDISILGDASFNGNDMLRLMADNQKFDFLLANLAEGAPATKEFLISRLRDDIASYLEIKAASARPLIVVIEDKSLGSDDHDNWTAELSASRSKLREASIPFYPSVARAARAMRKMIDYYQKRA